MSGCAWRGDRGDLLVIKLLQRALIKVRGRDVSQRLLRDVLFRSANDEAALNLPDLLGGNRGRLEHGKVGHRGDASFADESSGR